MYLSVVSVRYLRCKGNSDATRYEEEKLKEKSKKINEKRNGKKYRIIIHI